MPPVRCARCGGQMVWEDTPDGRERELTCLSCGEVGEVVVNPAKQPARSLAERPRAREWVIHIDATLLPTLPSPNDRLHWSVKGRAVKAWRTAVWAETQRMEIPRLGAVRIVVTLGKRSIDRMDADNLVSSCKPLVDGLQGCYVTDAKGRNRVFMPGILANDDKAHVPDAPLVFEVKSKVKFIEIRVTEL